MSKLADMDKIKVADKYYLSIDDYAKYKGKTRKTIYNWIDDGKVTVKKILNRQFIEL
jgi:predicted DNA-binding transcriptional regulator AlpA